MEPDSALEQELERFAEAVLPHERHLTAVQLAAESGVDLELARRLRRAMGLPDVDEDEPAFYEEDLDALRMAKALADEQGLGEADLLHLARTLGLAAARMADAVVGFWVDRSAGSADSNGRPSEDMLTGERVDVLEEVVGYLLRRHLLDAVVRRIGSAQDVEAGSIVAVGFADLVGFTSLSEQLDDRETVELIERFEIVANDLVVGGGGRVIKMIGDEVMFSADPADVAEIALGLAEAFDSPDLPAVRVGVAAGKVVSQSGDLYGPVVNLASRATMAARPGSVLISPSLAEMLAGDDRYSVAALRPHRLKGIGFVVLAVLRRAEDARRGRRPTRRAG